MPLDHVAKALIETLEQTLPRVEDYESAEDVRAVMAAIPRELPEPEPVARVEHHVAPGADGMGVVVRVYWPADDDRHRPGVLFFHGGGWVIGDLESHDQMCRQLANALDAVAIAVDYRRAPEHKFPAAPEDCYSALEWAAANAAELLIDEHRLSVAGDSAGGNLAAAVALMTRDRGGPGLVHQLMIYPVIDSTAGRNEYPSKVDNASGYFLRRDAMEWYRVQYLAADADGDDPYCSPNQAKSLEGLPPAYILTAEYDPLRDEGEHFGKLLEAAGVPTTVNRWPGMFHGFFGMDAVLDGAKEAQRTVYDAVRPVLHRTDIP
jgi:acetyl esterase